VTTLDCRAAQFSSEEPTMRLRMICQSWKVMFHAEYSSGQPLRMLVDLHTIVNAALEASGGANITSAGQASGGNKTAAASIAGAESGSRKPAAPARAKAAAAGAGFAAPASDAPEFEISSTPKGWDPDGSS
jgi:hypothetical protein